MSEHKTKRDILQGMLDEISAGWIIIKPSANEPDSLEDICRFRQPGERLSVKVFLQWTQFQYPEEWPQIIEQIRKQIEVAKSRRA
jgi:hypothetical protein